MNLRHEAIKLLEENIGSKLLDMGLRDDFLNLTSKAKGKISKWDCIKLKNFCTVNETINKLKRQPNEWKKTFTNHISDEVVNIQKI